MNLQYEDECPEGAEQLEDEELEEWNGFRSEDLADAMMHVQKKLFYISLIGRGDLLILTTRGWQEIQPHG